jgi:hypothetical protein
MKIIDPDKNYLATDLAYMAGIVDGEGSITITDCSRTQGRTFFSTSLGVVSTDKPLIDWIICVFGGHMGSYTPKQTPKNSRKKVYRWQVTGKNLETVLNLIYPYVVIKKREIEVMLAMRKTYNARGFCSKVDSEMLALRKQYTAELASLHCRNYNNKK